MQQTGERQHTETVDIYAIEHLHRYVFAMKFVKNKQVVDIASGEGYGSHLLSSVAKAVVGIDISQEAVNFANQKYHKSNLLFKQGSATEIPVPDNSVDVVVSFETIEHHDKHNEMMLEIRRILKVGGLLIISTPQKDITAKEKNPYHVKELDYEEFSTLVSKNFSYTQFLFQKTNFTSIISSQEAKSFFEFSGDFNAIQSQNCIIKPMYNIALASQTVIPQIFNSAFDGFIVWKQMEETYWMQHHELVRLQKNMEDLQQSPSFKVGRILLTPLRILKNIL